MNPLSGVLGEAWQLYRKFAAHLLAIAFIIYLVAAIVAALLGLAGVIGSLLALVVELFAGFLLQATLVKAVQDIRDGRADLSLGETVSAAAPYIWSVAGASILAGIAIAVGLILLIVPGLWLITIWAVIIPVIIIERVGALDSFGRSRRLVRGHGWHVFGTLVLVFIIQLVVDIVLGLIFSALPHIWRSGLSTFISGVLIAPFIALVVTLIYYRLVGAAGPGAVSDAAAPGGYGTPPGGYGTPPGGYGTPPPTDYGTAPPADYGTPPPTDYRPPPPADYRPPPPADYRPPTPEGQDAPAPEGHEAPPTESYRTPPEGHEAPPTESYRTPPEGHEAPSTESYRTPPSEGQDAPPPGGSGNS